VLDDFAVDTTTFNMRLNLWDAEVTGGAQDIDGADGGVSWRVFAHAGYADADVIAVELNHTVGAAGGAPSWRFEPAAAARPWAQRACSKKGKFPPNPAVTNATMKTDGAVVFVQAHLRGTEHATAALTGATRTTTAVVADRSGGTRTMTTTTTVMFVSTSSVLGKGAGEGVALEAVRAAAAHGLAPLLAAHRDWWHAYYPSGAFLTMAEPRLESFCKD